MPLGTPAPLNKRKKPSKIITDLSHISQDEFELEPEASEFDLGTKIRTPKEIMLEELSLLKNRGSKMFRMRQQRVEKFIYENNPDIFTSDSMDNFQKFVPSLGGQIGGQFINIGGHYVSKETRHLYLGATPVGGGAPVPPPKPGSKWAGAGGAGGGDLSGDDKGSKGEGTSEWSSSRGWYSFLLVFVATKTFNFATRYLQKPSYLLKVFKLGHFTTTNYHLCYDFM
ncbi:hypothetical protein XENORESO_010408, partial [Xenotaenia resolanae]